ncbi:MAG: polysaccharide deacetylase family protein [Acidimicrobiales bacterium]
MQRHRTVLACILSAAVGFASALVVVPRSSAGDSPEPRATPGAVVFGVRTNQHLVALTFDDGPDPRWTPQVLALLHRFHATATFFDVGRQVLARPDLVQAELAAGNQIGDHTWSHPDLATLSPSAVQAEIAKGADALRSAGAPEPHLFRPPYGYTDEAVGVLADASQYRTVFWNLTVERFVDHADGVAGGVARMLTRVRPGTIILAHDGGVPDRSRTLAALPLLLGGLASRGYRVVDVDTLLRAASPVAAAARAAP